MKKKVGTRTKRISLSKTWQAQRVEIETLQMSLAEVRRNLGTKVGELKRAEDKMKLMEVEIKELKEQIARLKLDKDSIRRMDQYWGRPR